MSKRLFVLSTLAALSLAATAEALVTQRAPAQGTLEVTVQAANDDTREALIGSSVRISNLDGSLETRVVVSPDAASGSEISLPAGLYQVRWELAALSEIDAELEPHESAPSLVVIAPDRESSVVLRPVPARAISASFASAARLALR